MRWWKNLKTGIVSLFGKEHSPVYLRSIGYEEVKQYRCQICGLESDTAENFACHDWIETQGEGR